MEFSTALSIASLVSSGVSAVTSYFGGQQQAKAARARGEYEAGVAQNNQILAERQARDAKARGETSAQTHAMKVKQLIGQQRAALAGSGVAVDTGSALSITEDTAGIGALDIATIRHNADREALGFRTQGMNFAASGELASLRAEGEAAAASGAGYGALFGGIGSVAEKWYTFRRPGGPLAA